jgi:hypothetical protein
MADTDAGKLAAYEKENLAFLIKIGQIKDPKPAVQETTKDKE